ncbi:MAG: hypothetical protein EOO52_13390 [Gammaproteobacteria bacterium]|nr:MAG: hypothetical protein EOO52_13390 [Gammaproteobacteria bacterium]
MINFIFIVVVIFALLAWSYSRHTSRRIKAGVGQQSFFAVGELDYARNIAKRLDEHRELVESIESSTNLLTQKSWHVGHLATQDDFLMKLFYLRHGQWPVGAAVETGVFGHVRSRPKILGECSHPDFCDRAIV